MKNSIENVVVGVYPLYEGVEVPRYGTEGSACFDLSAYLNVDYVYGYNRENHKIKISVVDGVLCIDSGCRVLVPTGFKFHIPIGYSLRIHPRSGFSLKLGLTIGNCEGVIDYDYPEQTYVMLFNVSDVPVSIRHGERIAQAEVVPLVRAYFRILDDDITERYSQYFTRTSGFGHTGS